MFLLTISCSVSAKCPSSGYIVKVSDNAVMMFSAKSETVTLIGDGYYRADSLSDVYKRFMARDIEVIFPNYQLELFENVYPNVTSDTKISEQWNLDLICAESAREAGVFGKGVKIAVLDSGLNIAHADFKGANILAGYNCMEEASDVNDVSDNFGHGTAVSGVIAAVSDNQTAIAGIADAASIIPLKITDGKSLTLSNIYAGIKKATELECDIINMSFGGAITDEIAISTLKSWVDKATDAGMVVVAAVGNGGTALNYPAAFDNVIGVGAVGKNKLVSQNSQNNESVFVAAPGDDILTLSNDVGMVLSTGTSLATPHVTAAIALIKELKPSSDLEEIKEILKSTSEDLGDAGYDVYYGNGLLNIKGIIKNLQVYLPNVAVSQGIMDGKSRIHIHNNTGDKITADVFFAKYDDGKLISLNMTDKTEFGAGVTSCFFDGEYDCFMLWKNLSVPYIEKYILKIKN